MHKMTEDNLKAAFAGESQAHLKYLNFAEKARQEEKPNVARLFAAASFAEQVHASAHLRVLQGVASTAENLGAAITGEAFEVAEMYPAFMSVADTQAEIAAKGSFYRANEAEKVHKELYTKAKEAVEAGNDVTLGDILVCSTCGFTAEASEIDRCPLCGAPKERLTRF